MNIDTLPGLVDHWADTCPDRVWLRDLRETAEQDVEYTWAEARAEIQAMAAMLESRFGSGERMVVLSRNRPHWFMSDLAVIASGNVTVSMFTTLPGSTAKYILDFTDTKVIFVGETSNWEAVSEVLAEDVTIITLPGVVVPQPHLKWEDLLSQFRGQSPSYECKHDDLMSLVFTSGTTGMPKGVMQTHDSNLIPIRRFIEAFGIRDNPRYFSYLPLSHIAERQIVEFSSLVACGEVNFSESLETLLRDLQRTRPHMFFGPPRIWEQFQQAVIGKFGGKDALAQALDQDEKGIGQLILDGIGLTEVEYCLTAAAPTPPALIHWWDRLGLVLSEGFGQTEAMGLIVSSPNDRRVGSIGKPVGDVEIKLTDEDELAVRATGCTPGYYKQPEKTAELIQDGWYHTGDKARIDEDGFIYITGRVKDYFKTIQGKFVAPPPIEGEFAKNPHAEQQCLLGRGFSKTVMIAVLTDEAGGHDNDMVEQSLRETTEAINSDVEKHARIGAVIVSREPWSIENEVLTPTLKIRREKVEERFGELAERLAREAAEQGALLVHWH
ncbi:AMP-binding protein [Halioglobus pacificus]|uniref:AMP-dependent synthetase n=1 Tax=Parahalioglobus pacificus TaxID=930806 RepID=A0A919CK87_9GAMM|nr:AMP-binding protein [Halioglobus pacificus]GHD31857.1 AMP-dependent synthetase [Halioglobus pacificus]